MTIIDDYIGKDSDALIFFTKKFIYLNTKSFKWWSFVSVWSICEDKQLD